MIKKLIYNLFDYFFQNDLTDEIVKYLDKSKKLIIFDIGCYLGNFSRNLKKKINKNSYFFLFDANPNLMILDFKYNNLAISSEDSVKDFYLNTLIPHSGSSLSNISKNDLLWNLSRKLFFLNFKKNFKKIKLLVSKLDTFCKKKNINKINILKIDVEGSELEVLRGAEKQLKKVDIILIEAFDKKNLILKKIQKIDKILLIQNNFTKIKMKKIRSIRFLSNLAAYDILYRNQKAKKN